MTKHNTTSPLRIVHWHLACVIQIAFFQLMIFTSAFAFATFLPSCSQYEGFDTIHHRTQTRRHQFIQKMTISKLPQAEKQSLSKSSTATSPSNNDENDEKVQIAFPGGGIYFYWQIGAASYLRDIQQYDLSNVQFTGASAGALAATLTVTNVNFVETTHLALKLAEDAGVWDRPMGLQG